MGELIDLDAYRSTMANELTVDRDPNQPDVVICMDDREIDPNCPVLDSTVLYSQLAGAAYGVGHDTAVVMEVIKPGSFTNIGKPLFTMASLVAKLCNEKKQLVLLNHHGCAAQQSAQDVDQTIVNYPETTFESARLFKPDLDELLFERIVAGTGNLLVRGTWTDPHKALRKLEQGEAPDFPPISAVTLADRPHNAVGHTIDYRKNKVLDVVRANKEDMASYYTSATKIMEAAEAIQSTLPIKYEDLLSVHAVRLGAIRAKHLLGQDGMPLPVALLAD